MSISSGSPRARAPGAAMRQARENAKTREPKLGVREVARRIGVHYPTISYWETGKKVPALEDIASYLTAIGVTGAERDRILELGREATDANWLTAGTPGISQGLAGVLDCERTASRITEWSPLSIPGLLQIPESTRAIVRTEHDALLRAGRREILTRPEPAQLVALIGEPALLARIGGEAVHLLQLKQLLKLAADLPNVTIQVVRTERESWHPGMAGPFILYDFPGSPSIVHLEHHRSSAFLYDDEDVAEYRKAAALLCDEVAMNPSASLDFIAKLIREAGGIIDLNRRTRPMEETSAFGH